VRASPTSRAVHLCKMHARSSLKVTYQHLSWQRLHRVQVQSSHGDHGAFVKQQIPSYPLQIPSIARREQAGASVAQHPRPLLVPLLPEETKLLVCLHLLVQLQRDTRHSSAFADTEDEAKWEIQSPFGSH
jgi:hypothetical protein